jgi:hypothetical protein
MPEPGLAATPTSADDLTSLPTNIPADPAKDTAQPHTEQINVGPNPQDVPPGYNPLTGLPVSDPSTLELPAVLISITNFPPSARPQAGLSFSPWVFEIYIAEGMTRYLAAFHGDFPQNEQPLKGTCAVNTEPFQQNGTMVGNFVWWDVNGNGIQDSQEPGIGGVCINLYDAATGGLVARTTTDINGYYGFNLPSAGNYFLEFLAPGGMVFTPANVGDDDHDSDTDPSNGHTASFSVTSEDTAWDAGLIKQGGLTGAGEANTGNSSADTSVGPVRSGRLPYVYIRDFFQDSCLIYAGATEQIRAKLRGCAMVFGNDSSNINSAMLDITRMEKIAEENKRPADTFNYTGNLFAPEPPGQGALANIINVFYSFLNQSQWKYDDASGMYLKYEDFADGSGKFRPATDRLTGEQLAFSNVIVLFAQHDAVHPYIIDIALGAGQKGKAVVFRDGQRFDVFWTTVNGEYEQSTGLRRPIRFTDANGNPFALKPGQSWVHVVTPASAIFDKGGGTWQVRFYAPAGSK